ncbi:MBL fold metallo-hydrolase [Pseudomonas sp. PDM12]|nr:MBL fold metallo-hydrolase [Pseudomonas sp. PDM12]
MTDFFEIDFLAVETKKSGDAIAMRYSVAGKETIAVVDGGFASTGEVMVNFIKENYGNPKKVDYVILTHPDGDHAVGLRSILNDFEVGELWMLRPWEYAEELIDRFATYNSVDRLRSKLRDVYYNTEALEKIAIEKGIPIKEPFQGAKIGQFHVLAPSRERYIDLVVESDKTPEAEPEPALESLASLFETAKDKIVNFFRAAWGEEVFSPNDTSRENEMSVVQYAYIAGKRILLTGDAGREALTEVVAYAPNIGLQLPGIDKFQVPHHGSRRNVSTDLLDALLGPRVEQGSKETFTAIVSSAKADVHHPRKSVKRAMIHRGARLVETEGRTIRIYQNAPERAGWMAAPTVPYPDDQEAN